MKSKVPKLIFSPYAYAKYIWFRDRGKTEISAMAQSSVEDRFYIEDIHIIKQKSSAALTTFDDDGFAEYMEDMVMDGHSSSNVGRIWLHTHPGFSSTPSMTDEDTFKDKFGLCSWAIMGILSHDDMTVWLSMTSEGQSYYMKMEIDIDWKALIDNVEINKKDFEEEYKKIEKVVYVPKYYQPHTPRYTDKKTYGKRNKKIGYLPDPDLDRDIPTGGNDYSLTKEQQGYEDRFGEESGMFD